MNEARVKLLEQFYEENPTDPFNLYALALEHAKTDTDMAASLFDKLIIEYEDYLPTYYQAVEFFAAKNQLDKAIEIGKRGIDKAKRNNQLKMLGELKSLLESIE
jgi:tetratricopeptide (TPR) repeat protein